MKFNNILVAISPESEIQYALNHAIRLINEQQTESAKVTLFLTVYDFSYEMSALLSSEERNAMHATIIEQRQAWLQTLVKQHGSPHIQFETQVVWHSNEADALVEQIHNAEHDIVFKYAKCDEGMSSLLFTPIDWQLLRKSSCPVMIVRDGDTQAQRRILVAVNVSDDEAYHETLNKKLIKTGLDLAKTLDRGNIHLVNAYPATPVNMAIDLPDFNLTDSSTTIRGQHLINMKALRQHFSIDEDHTHVYEGLPEEVIPNVAKEINAELVILGTIGRTGLSAAFLGNTAEQVIQHLNCSLLTIKPDELLSDE